jgi:hypothetical protein
MSHGLLFNVDYTYSHSIDSGSTWHSGATTANGAAGGEGFTTDQTLTGLDRGNSIYDIRHRLVFNYVWQLPGQDLKGALGVIAGGWSLNGIWQFQSGAHWEPFVSSGSRLRESDGVTKCTTADIASGNCFNLGGDFNLDQGRNDRSNSSVTRVGGVSHNSWANGWGATLVDPVTGTVSTAGPSVTFSTPCLGCAGNLGRNSFVGPGNWSAAVTMSKVFKLTERVNLKFEANAFNVFNRANFILATAGGGANNKYAAAGFDPNVGTAGYTHLIPIGSFGEAAGTLSPRVMQFGVKFSF